VPGRLFRIAALVLDSFCCTAEIEHTIAAIDVDLGKHTGGKSAAKIDAVCKHKVRVG